MNISILGPEGTFSHEAALAYQKDAHLLFENTIYDVFDALDKGRSSVSIVPFENSTSGSVGETLDAFLEFDVKISNIMCLRISYNLVGGKKEEIKRLYVHPLAHAQCRGYIRKNFAGAEVVHTSSNAASAKLAKNRGEGAIVPGLAAQVYHRNIIESKVEDSGRNVTLFAVLSNEYSKRTGNDMTFIVFDCVDRPGVLCEILGLFAGRGINLSKIESRPNKRKMGEYVFYLEFSGHPDDAAVAEVLKGLKRKTVFLKVLGGYPAGERE